MLFLDQDRLALARIERALETINKRLDLLTETIMATMEDVRQRVEAQRTVTASVVTLLADLRQQLQSAIAAGDPAAIRAVADAIEENTRTLANAVVSGTPAAASPQEPSPSTPVEPPPPLPESQ
jgi:N-acetylglucosamine kinase-like BadF-type ATPase